MCTNMIFILVSKIHCGNIFGVPRLHISALCMYVSSQWISGLCVYERNYLLLLNVFSLHAQIENPNLKIGPIYKSRILH